MNTLSLDCQKSLKTTQNNLIANIKIKIQKKNEKKQFLFVFNIICDTGSSTGYKKKKDLSVTDWSLFLPTLRVIVVK